MTAPQQCRICGKRGQRPCPATGGWICPACCGSQRGSQLACPPECTFYPLGTANPRLWHELNEGWAVKSMRYLQTRLGEQTVAGIVQRFASGRTPSPETALLAYFPTVYHGLFVHRDAQGRTAADVWEAEGWAGLNNDERVMIRYRRQSFVTVLELQRTLAGEFFECLDLLEPGSAPIRVLDHVHGRQIPRFTKMLVWLTHYPHFSRIGGIWFVIPEALWPDWLEHVQQRLVREQKTRPDLTLKQSLAAHMWENQSLLEALFDRARKRLLESIGVHHCVAEFKLSASMDTVRQILESRPEFRAEPPKPTPGFETPPHFYVWQAKGECEDLPNHLPQHLRETASGAKFGLGQLRLYPERLLLETFAQAAHEAGKTFLGKLLVEQASFVQETVVDLAKQIEQREALWPVHQEAASESTSAPPPPVSEAERERIRAAHREQCQSLLDTPQQRLDGLTARAASRDPALRPQLLECLKDVLRQMDHVNLRHGLDLNMDAVLDELGVPELKN